MSTLKGAYHKCGLVVFLLNIIFMLKIVLLHMYIDLLIKLGTVQKPPILRPNIRSKYRGQIIIYFAD